MLEVGGINIEANFYAPLSQAPKDLGGQYKALIRTAHERSAEQVHIVLSL